MDGEGGRVQREYRIDPAEVAGLVEVPIGAGMRLFSGSEKKVSAKGVMTGQTPGHWKQVRLSLEQRRFIPKMDSYYMSLFIAAKSLLSGEKYLSI